MYFDSNSNAYPATYDGSSNTTGLQALVDQKFLPTLPKDPNGDFYKYCSPPAGTSYHLGAVMESPDSPAFQSDSDDDNDGCGSPGTFLGESLKCDGATLGSGEKDLCYDVTP